MYLAFEMYSQKFYLIAEVDGNGVIPYGNKIK